MREGPSGGAYGPSGIECRASSRGTLNPRKATLNRRIDKRSKPVPIESSSARHHVSRGGCADRKARRIRINLPNVTFVFFQCFFSESNVQVLARKVVIIA